MSRYLIKPEQALMILKEVASASRKWGKNVRLPYSQVQLVEAIELADDAGCFTEREPELISKDELTKLRRQLAAALNREKARQKREMEHPESEAAWNLADAGNGVDGDL